MSQGQRADQSDPAYDKAVHHFVSRVLDENTQNVPRRLPAVTAGGEPFSGVQFVAQTLSSCSRRAGFLSRHRVMGLQQVDPDNRRPVD